MFWRFGRGALGLNICVSELYFVVFFGWDFDGLGLDLGVLGLDGMRMV